MIEDEDPEDLLPMNSPIPSSNQLPIHAHRRAILYSIHTHQVTIVMGCTDSGKSTQIPKYLHEAGWTSPSKSITICHPQRLAAISATRRLSEELSCELGTLVGYTVRFEDRTSQGTRIRYTTDASLLKELLYDPPLAKCSVVILEGAHERSVATELLCGLLKRLIKHRPELRLVISATATDADVLQAFFTEPTRIPPIIAIKERTFPVHIHYLLEPCHDYINAATDTVLSIHSQTPSGDILVFMTDIDEIRQVVEAINAESTNNLIAFPLHASMNLHSQSPSPHPPHKSGKRRVIVATSIAEASPTIDGVGYVVDSGRVKMRCYDAGSSIDVMLVTLCSKASTNQRAGKAGRVSAGHAYRLYTKDEYLKRMPAQSIPGLHKCELSGVLLQVGAMGIDKVAALDLPSGWPVEHIRAAIENLIRFGAFDPKTRALSTLGLQMAEFPLDPATTRLLLSGNRVTVLGRDTHHCLLPSHLHQLAVAT